MTRGRGRCGPPPGPAGSPQASKPKANRLSRSFRQTGLGSPRAQTGVGSPRAQTGLGSPRAQTGVGSPRAQTGLGSPRAQASDFKTPTRISRSREASGFSGESPHNESDFQQDIIWDAASPSPNRLGKRGRKHPAGVVDISEIVSRIAPKHGRPKVAEPTLERWIGDSAAIPCTPDVQVPKLKKKSPRPNAVDDLLKLAKQFDLNMFHRDEEEVEVMHQQSLELLSGDILDFERGEQNCVSAPLPESCEACVNAAVGADVQVHLGRHMEDDLDFLFDGPTQHISGNLSQMSAAQPSHFRDVSGKLSSPPASVASKGASANGEFGDDWDDDDLLNDSLVFEMTQNPQKFDAPKHCLTQNPAGEAKHEAAIGGWRLTQSAVSEVEKENVRQRTTFRLDSNPNFSVKRIPNDTWTSTKVDSSSDMQVDSSRKAFSVEAASQKTCLSAPEPQKSLLYQRASASSESNATDTKATQSFPKEPVSSSNATPAVCHFPDEDLDSFFSSDLVWDDPADSLLCEMCEDLENQIQSTGNVPIRKALSDVRVLNQKAALQPSNRTWHNATQQPARARGGGPAGSSPGASDVSAGVWPSPVKVSFRYSQTKTASGSTSSSRVRSAVTAARDRFTFKKPNNPVSTVTHPVVAKCSAAEIELKKQQAKERRRRRLQAAQNLQAPT